MEAIEAMPRPLRLRFGYLRWEGALYSLSELKRVCQTLSRQIDADRLAAQQAAKTHGRAMPDNWRHPEQDRLDDLNALLDEANNARRR